MFIWVLQVNLRFDSHCTESWLAPVPLAGWCSCFLCCLPSAIPLWKRRQLLTHPRFLLRRRPTVTTCIRTTIFVQGPIRRSRCCFLKWKRSWSKSTPFEPNQIAEGKSNDYNRFVKCSMINEIAMLLIHHIHVALRHTRYNLLEGEFPFPFTPQFQDNKIILNLFVALLFALWIYNFIS